MSKDPVFKANPSLKSYFKTSDGQAFYKKENAEFHARSNKLKDRNVTEVFRSESVDEKVSAKELIKLINKAETVEAVDALVSESEDRSTVKDAAEKRKTALNEA